LKRKYLSNRFDNQLPMSINIQAYFDCFPEDVTNIDVSGKNIDFLPDLTRFTKLELLFCYDNQLTCLPTLPPTLKSLYCSKNKLSSLPELPDSLENLCCSNNHLTFLPPLPDNIILLSCDHNWLTSLPTLPPSIETLYCCSNWISSLPEFPESIYSINCTNNCLTFLPKLPDSLITLFCDKNPMRILPDLPNSLLRLMIDRQSILYKYIDSNYYSFDDNSIYQIISYINRINRQLQEFKYLFYSLKYKHRFRNWLWEKVREKKLRQQFHPLKICALLKKGIEIDDLELYL